MMCSSFPGNGYIEYTTVKLTVLNIRIQSEFFNEKLKELHSLLILHVTFWTVFMFVSISHSEPWCWSIIWHMKSHNVTMSPSLSYPIHLGEKTDKEAKKELFSHSNYTKGVCCRLQELLQNLSRANLNTKTR